MQSVLRAPAEGEGGVSHREDLAATAAATLERSAGTVAPGKRAARERRRRRSKGLTRPRIFHAAGAPGRRVRVQTAARSTLWWVVVVVVVVVAVVVAVVVVAVPCARGKDKVWTNEMQPFVKPWENRTPIGFNTRLTTICWRPFLFLFEDAPGKCHAQEHLGATSLHFLVNGSCHFSGII